jgi:hypothetical protein
MGERNPFWLNSLKAEFHVFQYCTCGKLVFSTCV